MTAVMRERLYSPEERIAVGEGKRVGIPDRTPKYSPAGKAYYSLFLKAFYSVDKMEYL